MAVTILDVKLDSWLSLKYRSASKMLISVSSAVRPTLSWMSSSDSGRR